MLPAALARTVRLEPPADFGDPMKPLVGGSPFEPPDASVSSEHI